MRSINFNIFVSTFLVYFCFFLEILLELCDLLNLANCTEKAVAIVQSMIEFNLYRPSSLDSHEAAIESFQEFYDSGESQNYMSDC